MKQSGSKKTRWLLIVVIFIAIILLYVLMQMRNAQSPRIQESIVETASVTQKNGQIIKSDQKNKIQQDAVEVQDDSVIEVEDAKEKQSSSEILESVEQKTSNDRKRGSVTTLQDKLRAHIFFGQLSTVAQDVMNLIGFVFDFLLSTSDKEKMPEEMYTDNALERKRGYILFKNGEKITVTLYNNLQFLIERDERPNISLNVANVVTLKPYHFEFDAYSEISQKEMDYLLQIKQQISKNSEEIEMLVLIGHTCNIGYDDYNSVLSGKRAQFIADTLSDLNLNIMAIGRGKHFPVVENDNPENRSKNRRAELFIITKDHQ